MSVFSVVWVLGAGDGGVGDGGIVLGVLLFLGVVW